MNKVIVLILICLISFSCKDLVVSYYFDNYDGVINNEIVEKGWLKEGFPKNLTDIFYQHDLDTNIVWMSAVTTPESIDEIVSLYNFSKTSVSSTSSNIYPYYEPGFKKYQWKSKLKISNKIINYQSGLSLLSYDEEKKRFFLYLVL